MMSSKIVYTLIHFSCICWKRPEEIACVNTSVCKSHGKIGASNVATEWGVSPGTSFMR